MSQSQVTWAGASVVVLLVGLLALLLGGMARSREVEVEEDFWLVGPLDRVAAALPAALGEIPGLRVEVLDRTTFQLVRRGGRRTPVVLVGTEHGPMLRVTGRLDRDQLPALREALGPMTARA